MKTILTASVLATTVLLIACNGGPVHTAEFGGSLNELQQKQTVHPQGYEGPVQGVDARKGEIALEIYQGGKSTSETAKETMQISQ